MLGKYFQGSNAQAKTPALQENSNVVELWTVPLDTPLHTPLDRPLDTPQTGLLSGDEAARAARFRSAKDRLYWTNARLALRSILAGYTGDAPESLRFVCNANGKPSLDPEAGIEFNLSHAGDFALIGVSRSGPVGVDIERIRTDVDIAVLLRRLGETDLPEAMAELYHRWTRREARSKAVGGQLFVAPPPGIEAIDVPAPDGYAASVAALRGPISVAPRRYGLADTNRI